MRLEGNVGTEEEGRHRGQVLDWKGRWEQRKKGRHRGQVWEGNVGTEEEGKT